MMACLVDDVADDDKDYNYSYHYNEIKTDDNVHKEMFCIWLMADNKHDGNYLPFIEKQN
jgi:hypothetical protein